MRNVSYGPDDEVDDDDVDDDDDDDDDASALGFSVQNAPSKCGLPI
jgi:hypothetical protein